MGHGLSFSYSVRHPSPFVLTFRSPYPVTLYFNLSLSARDGRPSHHIYVVLINLSLSQVCASCLIFRRLPPTHQLTFLIQLSTAHCCHTPVCRPDQGCDNQNCLFERPFRAERTGAPAASSTSTSSEPKVTYNAASCSTSTRHFRRWHVP